MCVCVWADGGIMVNSLSAVAPLAQRLHRLAPGAEAEMGQPPQALAWGRTRLLGGQRHREREATTHADSNTLKDTVSSASQNYWIGSSF